MPDLAVEIQQSNDQFRVVWYLDNTPTEAYLVDPGGIRQTSDEIRAQLTGLVNTALAEQDAKAQEDEMARAQAQADRIDILNQLVQKGWLLHELLFTAEAGSQASQSSVDEIRNYIAALPPKRSICFYVSPKVKITWGLAFDSSVKPVRIESADASAYGGFWCLKHQVATLHSELARRWSRPEAFPAASFRLLSGGNTQEWSAAQNLLNDPSEKQALALLTTLHQPVASSADLIKEWKSREATLGLLYLYCHANASQLQFTSLADRMNVSEFKVFFKKEEGNPARCLVLLNGCHTAADDERGTFMEATARQGFCGYIGAEVEVPKMFAFRFGLAFQCLLFSGQTVGDIMDRLRTQHWPLSLVYALYALPQLRVTNDPNLVFPELPKQNYSEGPLGTTQFSTIP